MNAGLTLGSLFDGIAGFPLAAGRHGIKTVWTSEIEPNCIDIAGRHFPDAVNLGDITGIKGGEIPVVDIISFGSPCQDLSVAGAFSSNKGEDFRRVLEEITEASIPMPTSGKWASAGLVGIEEPGGDLRTVAWRQLDAQFWGVPQRRKRIYLVTDFRNGRAGQILFECESVLGYSVTGREEGKGSSDNPKDSPIGEDSGGLAEEPGGQMKLDFGRTADRIYINAKKSVTLMGREGGGGGKTGLYLLPVYTIAGNVIGRDAKHGGNQLGINQDVAPTLTSTDRHAVAYTQSGYAEFKEGVGTIKKSRGAAGGGSETLAVIIERIAAAVKYRVRRLTPLECERLDGFPDYWTRYGASGREMSDNARYMALGNSIAVPCAERVFIGIIKAEREGGNHGGTGVPGIDMQFGQSDDCTGCGKRSRAGNHIQRV